jgi:hypothetical protein
VWQAIYEELRGEGLEIIAVAFDTGGKAAVEAKIRAADLAERPAVLAAGTTNLSLFDRRSACRRRTLWHGQCAAGRVDR